MSNAALSIHTRSLLTAIATQGTAALYGIDSLMLAQRVLHELATKAGYQLVYDPNSSPDLLDLLGVAGSAALQGAAFGGGLGSVIGLAIGYPGYGLAVGAVLGGLVGGSRGMNAIRAGLRVKATWLTPGFPEIIMEAR